MSEVLPCRICNKAPHVVHHTAHGRYSVFCGTYHGFENTPNTTRNRRDEAIRAWNEWQTIFVDDVMESAFAGLADALEAQDAELLQEVVDLWDVWGWLQDYGGYMTRIKRSKDSYGTLIAINTVDPDGGKVEYADLQQAANAIRIVRKYRVRGEGYA